MEKAECKKLNEHMQVFQKIMLDCVQRKTIFCAVEKSLIETDFDKCNIFFELYSLDYLRAQLSDLRKFFDTDNRVYRFSFITDHCEEIKAKHKKLFNEWESNYLDIANKVFFHKERNFSSTGVNKEELHKYLYRINGYLDEVISKLSETGYEITYLNRTGSFVEIEPKIDYKKFLEKAQIKSDYF